MINGNKAIKCFCLFYYQSVYKLYVKAKSHCLVWDEHSRACTQREEMRGWPRIQTWVSSAAPCAPPCTSTQPDLSCLRLWGKSKAQQVTQWTPPPRLAERGCCRRGKKKKAHTTIRTDVSLCKHRSQKNPSLTSRHTLLTAGPPDSQLCWCGSRPGGVFHPVADIRFFVHSSDSTSDACVWLSLDMGPLCNLVERGKKTTHDFSNKSR